ncbi:MAG: hypothetical protein JRN23_04285 [Nitrososphaerota archaeon]|nr:hypothetical protein [Nitrososphaerota archaeon]
MRCETCGRIVVDGPADANPLIDSQPQRFEEHLKGCGASSLVVYLPERKRA